MTRFLSDLYENVALRYLYVPHFLKMRPFKIFEFETPVIKEENDPNINLFYINDIFLQT